MARSLVLALSVSLAAAACAPSPPVASAVDADRAHVALARLGEGRTLLLAKCGGCHRTPLPTDHAAREWPKKLDEMAARARLEPTERMLIEGYLVTMARH